jgi:hypothetical protein
MIIKVEFEEQVWAQIINMLAEIPYKQSGAIINTIAMQIQEQRPPPDNAGNGPVQPSRSKLAKEAHPN